MGSRVLYLFLLLKLLLLGTSRYSAQCIEHSSSYQGITGEDVKTLVCDKRTSSGSDARSASALRFLFDV